MGRKNRDGLRRHGEVNLSSLCFRGRAAEDIQQLFGFLYWRPVQRNTQLSRPVGIVERHDNPLILRFT